MLILRAFVVVGLLACMTFQAPEAQAQGGVISTCLKLLLKHVGKPITEGMLSKAGELLVEHFVERVKQGKTTTITQSDIRQIKQRGIQRGMTECEIRRQLEAMYSDQVQAEVRIRIYDKLGVDQVRETVTITIGGATQVIQLDQQRPTGYVEFYGGGPGRYLASFQATTYYHYQGRLVKVSSQGQGTIHSQGDEDFDLVIDLATNPATIGLRQR